VQLVARIDNSAELLRPGLFVRVEVPLSNGVEVLTVPTGAVVEHERSSFLFIEESVGHYRRRDVRIGRANLERVEITSGLEAGTTVVSEGAFVLKSELLLEREE
jgi:cobalt-zinc-cadmium efflux system membrane fusion protein